MSDPQTNEDMPAGYAGGPDVDFLYYMFDWDDNILHMPTKIHLERQVEGRWEPYPVSPSQFALIRRDMQDCPPIHDDWDKDIECNAAHPGLAKLRAIREFVQHVVDLLGERRFGNLISVGVSDDDVHNVHAVRQFIEEELAQEFPDVRFVVYDTSNPQLRRGRKLVIRGQLELDLNHVPDDA
jgi:hypothetical protein